MYNFGKTEYLPNPIKKFVIQAAKKSPQIDIRGKKKIIEISYTTNLKNIVDKFPIDSQLKEKIKKTIENLGFSFPEYAACYINRDIYDEDEDLYIGSLYNISVVLYDHYNAMRIFKQN